MNFRQVVDDPLPSPFIVSEGEINFEFPVHLFLVDPFEGVPPSIPILYIAEFDGKILVAVPHSAWHRTISKRAIPASCLTKTSLLEVQACRMSNRMETEPEEKLKLWVGFLNREFETSVHTFIADFKCDHFFDDDEEDPLLPYAQSLVDVAHEHYAFFSAAEDPPLDGAPVDEEELIEGSGSPRSLLARVQKLEGTMDFVSQGMQQLLARETTVAMDPTTMRPPKKSAMRREAEMTLMPKGSPKTKPAPKFPMLDQGVVAAALQAGVSEANLQEMQRLIGSNAKAANLKDLNTKVKPDPLSEEEDGGEAEAQAADDAGLASQPGDPVHHALQKLTAIMEVLTIDKKKKTSTSRLDMALDNAGASGSDQYSIGAGKKSAAARRMLRTVYQEHPDEISAVIERLMYEDLNSQTLGPGLQPQGLNARSWVEFRSKIGNYKTAAHSSWSAAGILDSLIAGDVKRARAQCGLLLLQLDQASVDRGSWGLASELSLEGLPPYSSLSAHTPPSVTDGEQPFSKLLDPRWAEVSLAFLKDQDDYLQRRKNISRMMNPANKVKDTEEEAESERKRRQRAKAKAKAASSQNQQDA